MDTNAATNPTPGNLIEMAGRGMNGLNGRPITQPGVALGDRGTTQYTFDETGTNPGTVLTPPQSEPNAPGTRPIVVMAPGPFDGIFAFLATPGPLGIPYGGYLAVAAAIGVIIYMNLPADGKKKK